MKTFTEAPPDVLHLSKTNAAHFDRYEAVEEGNYYDRGITIEIKCDATNAKQNLDRVILKTDTCSINIPDLDTEIPSGKGKFCTIADLLVEVNENLQSSFGGTNSIQKSQFMTKLNDILKGNSGFTIKFEDSLGNSILQCRPQGDYDKHLVGLDLYKYDPQITCTTFLRTLMDVYEFDLPKQALPERIQYTGEEGIKKLVDLLKNATNIVGMTGAGISTESGIPAFRNDMTREKNTNSIRNRWDPTELVFSRIMAEEKIRAKYWDMHEMLQSIIDHVEPNASHQFFKYLFDQGKLLKLITQNIDGLHQRAGVSDDKIIEIHGTTHKVICYKCKRVYLNVQDIHQKYREKGYMGSSVPYCDDCGTSGTLKHATISFGEPLEEESLRESFKAANECDLMIVMGTSLLISPANKIPLIPVKNGVPLVILNLSETPLDPECTVLMHEKSGETCQRLLKELE
jgi:NAD-dependent deacetylase